MPGEEDRQGWLQIGRRIKAEWASMVRACRARSPEKVKLPFVPLHVSGKALRSVLEDLLPMLLGENPSLLTVISEDGRAVKAYAEDASGGVYERLERLQHRRGAPREELVNIAGEAGVRIGVVKEADTRFFELFAEEPEELLDALALLAGAGASALRKGWLNFDPPLPAAELARSLGLGSETIRLMARRLLPEGRYGLGLSCTGGAAALALEVGTKKWTAEEIEAASGSVTALARELVEDHGCGIALALRLPDVAPLANGGLSLAGFLRRRGEAWDARTRSGLEGFLVAIPWLIELAGMERDLEECSIGLESVLELLRSYLDSAREHARAEGVHLRVTAEGNEFPLTWDAEGLSEKAGPDPIEFDLAVVQKAVTVLGSDPLVGLRGLVPREVMDEASYATALVLLECRRPKGRLMLFGGPHYFFDRSWEGDACAIFIDRYGEPTVADFPSRALMIDGGGGRLGFDGRGLKIDLRFDEASSRSDMHGPGRYLRGTRLAQWLPGLEVGRSLHRFVSGQARLGGRRISFESGWMYLERGKGLLLRWPFGSTWHYASFLGPDGRCGSGVRAAPMLGASTPKWWREVTEKTVDGAVSVSLGDSGPVELVPAFEPGPPARVVRDCATFGGGRELRYGVISAVVAPFDEDGQVVFRLRCLCEDGVGLVEIPASLPGASPGARRCEVAFTDGGVSFLAEGRELLLVETGGFSFLRPHPAASMRGSKRLLRRALAWLRRYWMIRGFAGLPMF